MTPFLKQVARHFYESSELQNACFIFPNRRASVFFKKYLAECIAGEGRQTLFAPQLYTINDFFYKIARSTAADPVHQLLVLYEKYCELNPKHESLDEFIFWGGVLLSDFNDVDKYMVNPEALFANVSEYRDMQDSLDYLDPEQFAAIERFVSHFKTGGQYKDEFLKIWNILLPLYRNFNAELKSKGFAYEGQVYRELAERLKSESVADVLSESFPKTERFVFVGLNALNECERLLLKKLRNAGLALFCWDYSSDRIKDKDNKSSFFLAGNVEDFPQAFELDTEGLPDTEFNVLSVASSVGQAKQLPDILDRIGAQGIETAVVLPDENLLLSVLNSLPEKLDKINVTMGYPMNGSSLWSLMNDICALQMHLRKKDEKWYFYHKQLWSIFSNSIIKTILDEEESAVVDEIKANPKYYLSQEELNKSPLFEAIFRPVVEDPNKADEAVIARLQTYQQDLILILASKLKFYEDMSLELDFAKEYYLAIGRLSNYKLAILPASYFRLLSQVLGHAAVPFKGEPLQGLQIMGPLETRALDFENMVILSCNEGIFPRRNQASSFIPPELRKGFGLPTYEYQDAVWAYYFYRMIQRAKRVWLLYDSRTEGTRVGEESRYIKQLQLHFGAKIKRYTAKARIQTGLEENEITKTEEQVEMLRNERYLSASALKSYIKCKAKFYYEKVLGLSEPQEVSETLDAKMIGTVYHAVMEKFYDFPKVGIELLKSYLEADIIADEVEKRIIEELKTLEVSGKNLIYKDMICSYVRQTIKRDIELLESQERKEFAILGIEKKYKMVINGFKFVGYIDRMDSLNPGEVRIIDYKTGRVTEEDMNINEANAEAIVGKIFGENNQNRPDIALQLYLYDKFISGDRELGNKSVVNSVYSISNLFTEEIKSVRVPSRFRELMDIRLTELLEEIADVNVPFSRTEDRGQYSPCKYCDFKILCGR